MTTVSFCLVVGSEQTHVMYARTCSQECHKYAPQESRKEAMPTIRLETYIEATVERCFDLSLNVDLHRLSTAQTHERPIAGVMTGEMKLGDTVTWEAVHFGIKQHLTSQITAYERPSRFVDEMVQGTFREMIHLHVFVPQPPGTLMVDLFTFRAPLGLLGRVAETLVLTRYMKGLLLTRNRYLKRVAEANTGP
jgi:ligand-binding SRPBCC domain-containing protein